MYRVAIVGRPNVGKSTLFNRLSGTRKALVGNEPGITRDRIFQRVEWEDREFELIDTGGILFGESEEIPEKILEQAAVAIEGSDLVLLVVDARAGVMPLDAEAATFLKSHGREFWVVANKVDVPAVEPGAYEFAELGSDALFPVSCEHNLGFDELMEALAERIPAGKKTAEREIRVAIIGRPNVGKSSLVNRLLGEERVIVTSTPGTTRDAVDSQVTYHGRRFRIIDTAGIRRKGRTELMAEKLSVVMARKNIARADVVLLMIDASEGATKLDATIGGYAHDEGRPVVVLVNKWDLVEKDTQTMVRTEREYRSRMRFLDYAPMLFISARSGQRVHKVLEVAQRAHESSLTRVSTGELNQFLQREVGNMLERETSRKFFLKYACQVGSAPPTFVLFLRGSGKLHFSTERFLINKLRERYGFFATPIRLLQKASRKAAKK
ncbi:MAG: ribosome biogenesis GTPase Der [Acidobacteriota bacterium]|jgi:GTP-binding protein